MTERFAFPLLLSDEEVISGTVGGNFFTPLFRKTGILKE